MTVFDIAKARQKQNAELKRLREEANALLLDGTEDLYAAIRKYECGLIRWALKASDKSIVEAARKLKIPYQTLQWMINQRYPELLSERTEIRRRA